MSIEFLPSPLYILFCLCASGAMIFSAVKRRKQDRKGLVIAYIIISCAPLLMIIGRVMPKYHEIAVKLAFGVFIILFVELTVIAIYDISKGKLRKRSVIGLLLGWSIIIFFALIFLGIMK